MLAYHPALDPYHAAFRMLRILSAASTGPFELDRLRILDFYFAFPSLIRQIRLPRNFQSRRNRVTPPANKYNFNGRADFVFTQIRGLQDLGLQLLISADIIDRGSYQRGVVLLSCSTIPLPLQSAIANRNALEAQLVSFLVSDLATIPLLGQDGLKHRTLLMEYRYDTI